MIIPLILGFVYAVAAQSCDNFGISSSSGCACPIGFGGSTCSQPACGGDIFQGALRPVTPPTANGNLTAGSCSCKTGWAGLGCNVCQASSACQSGFDGVPHTGTPALPSQPGQNDTLVCSSAHRVYAAQELSCQVNNPTLQGIYPGDTHINFVRTLEPSLTPMPNTTSFGSRGFALAQVFYNGAEQFYCKADTCKQSVFKNATVIWDCFNLKCVCRPGTAFCGQTPALDLTNTINSLEGKLSLVCQPDSKCALLQSVLQSVFSNTGLVMENCGFGECVRQSVIDSASQDIAADQTAGSASLSGGVIAGLAVVGVLILLAFALLGLGCVNQRKARRAGSTGLEKSGGVGVEWSAVSYVIPGDRNGSLWSKVRRKKAVDGFNNDLVILDNLTGRVQPGQIMAILGPSGSGKTTLVEILAGKSKSGIVSGRVEFPWQASSKSKTPRVGFVPQQDVLPPTLTVSEALLFAARLRLPESIPDVEKQARVNEVMQKLGIAEVANSRIGHGHGEGSRGISGGEMRRVSIGLELVAKPDVLILDEPTSGLDSVSASKVARVLHAVAHDPDTPTAVIASIHQPSSQLYQMFDQVVVLAHGRTLYTGVGGFVPVEHLAGTGHAPPYTHGYNVADYLLEVASDPPLEMLSRDHTLVTKEGGPGDVVDAVEKGMTTPLNRPSRPWFEGGEYAATFLTQVQVLSGREWKVLRRDKSLFLTHVGVAICLGAFCGGLYYKTGITIAGFQSRIGCLFFLGALIAFSSLSALYNLVEIRPLFLRERSSSYYSPITWLLSRFIFDVVPLRIVPTIIVSTITYWMAGLAGDAAHFFKFLFILVLYALVMTLFNFLLGCGLRNGGIAILLSALTALYQMTFAGFFVHLNSIPPVLRWLQWLCPLKYTLEALSVNEVGSGLTIDDVLQGVPVSVSATLIMQLLFGFGVKNYYRDVLVLFGFIAGFGVGVVGVVWIWVRERR